MLKLGIALLAGLVVLAVVIEARDSKPGSISRSLTSLRVEARSKGIFMGKSSTVALQVIFVDAPRIHPEAQALIPDELHHANSVINGLILLGTPVKFVLLNEHSLALLYFLCYTDYSTLLCSMSSNEGVYHAKSPNQYLYHPTAKEAVGKAEPG
jgi:hypothetical protein